jgi:hypothetical protein
VLVCDRGRADGASDDMVIALEIEAAGEKIDRMLAMRAHTGKFTRALASTVNPRP